MKIASQAHSYSIAVIYILKEFKKQNSADIKRVITLYKFLKSIGVFI